MPTLLPSQHGANRKPSVARALLNFAFNAFMIVSVLVLGYIVLDREERYALGQSADLAAGLSSPLHAAGRAADDAPLPPD